MIQKRVISLAVPAVVLIAIKGGKVLGGLVDTFEITDVAADWHNEADTFAAVMGATATQGNDAVAVIVFVYFYTVTYVVICRVWLCARENNCVNAGSSKIGFYLLGNTHLVQTAIANDQSFFEAQSFCALASKFGTARTQNRNCRNKEIVRSFC